MNSIVLLASIYTFGENIPISWSLDSLSIVPFNFKMLADQDPLL